MTNSNYLTDCILYQICKIFLVYYKKRETLPDNTAKNTVILSNFMVWKFYGKAQFLHSFGRITQNYAETVPFNKISTKKIR